MSGSAANSGVKVPATGSVDLGSPAGNSMNVIPRPSNSSHARGLHGTRAHFHNQPPVCPLSARAGTEF